jgi:hypothetical protein
MTLVPMEDPVIKRYTLPNGCPKHSPWGAVDHGTRFAEGVFFVSTPSHGGFKLAAVHNLLIPTAFRCEGGWYEEDVNAAIVVCFMPLLFKPDEVLNARQSLRNWHWQAWETHFREIVPLPDSPCKAQALFIEEHANDLLVISASGDWHRAVPKGMVGVTATIQGSREPGSKHQHFLVSKAEYDTREKNPGSIFVIDPARHQAWDPAREVAS